MNTSNSLENQKKIETNNLPVADLAEDTYAIKEQKDQIQTNVQPGTSKIGTDNEEKEVNSKNLQNDRKVLNSGDQSNDVQKEEKQQDAKKTSHHDSEEHKTKSEPTLGEAFGSILQFFSATKNNLQGSLSKTVFKFQEVVLQSKIVSTMTGTEYKPLISSDLFKKEETKEADPENQKAQRSRTNRAQGHKKRTIEKDNSVKTLIVGNIKEKTLNPKESKLTIRKGISKLKAAEGPGSSPLKGKNEVEEQIRIHKIQEVKKMKKALLEKLDALNNQLFELEKNGLDSNREGSSPVRVVFNLEQYKKQQKEELELKKKQALEFTRKMNQERKELEQKREKKRDEQNALVMKDIDVLYQKQLDELATLKGGGSAKTKFEENIKKYKQENMFAALEEKKKSLKIMREFKKITGEEQTNKEGFNEDGQNDAEKKKSVKKHFYKSPVLAQVLKDDEVVKKQEAEKTQAKKDLYKKKLEYSKEVKSSYLPQVHASKYTFDPEGRIARAVHRSQNLEKNLIRNAGKDALYGYLEKMRNKYPDISKPRKNSEDDSQIQDQKHEPVKSFDKKQNNKIKQKQLHEEDNADYYGEEDMKNYELEEDVNLTDRAEREEFSRDFQYKAQDIKNLKNKSYQSDLKRKSVGLEDRLSDDSELIDRNFELHSKPNKKHQVEQKDEEDNQWEEELRNDQLILKDKISNMLGDIKKIETQMKQKEQKLLEGIDKRKNGNP